MGTTWKVVGGLKPVGFDFSAFRMKRFIVGLLEDACSWIHHIPVVRAYYPCVLASWSAKLDEKWQTGRWTFNKDA